MKFLGICGNLRNLRMDVRQRVVIYGNLQLFTVICGDDSMLKVLKISVSDGKLGKKSLDRGILLT